MAVTITWYPPHPAPTNLTVSLADGGSLEANTTYYYTVIAVGNSTNITGINADESGYFREGAAATEVSITTTSTQRTAVISWDAVTGCRGYYVYRRKSTQPDYTFYGAQLGGYGAATTVNTTYTDDGTSSTYWNRMLALTTVTGYPGNFDVHRGRGLLHVVPDASGGTVTIQDLHNAVGDTNFSEYDERTWNLLGTLFFASGGPITFTPSYQTINLLGNFYQYNGSSSSIFTFSNDTLVIYSHDFLRPYFQYALTTFSSCKIIFLSLQVDASKPAGWQVKSSTSLSLDKCDFTAASLQLYNTDCTLTGTHFLTFSVYTPNDTSYTLAKDFKATYLDLLTAKISYLKGVICYGGTDYSVRLSVDSSYYINLVNCYFPDVGDLPIMYWYGVWPGGDPQAPRSYCCLKYEFNLTVVDNNDNPIEGATVTIKDISGATVATLTTDSDGKVSQDLKWVTLERNDVGGNYKIGSAYTRYTYHTPHTVVITKPGYVTKTIKYMMDREREEIEVLENRREV